MDAALLQQEGVKGLRFNGGLTGRAIRAKYPNGNMELSGLWLVSAHKTTMKTMVMAMLTRD